MGTTVINQKYIHKEIKGRLNSGNNCYHVVQNLLSSLGILTCVKISQCKQSVSRQ
jgi:hypothetical protein